MDGGFVKKKIKQRTNNFPLVADFRTEVERIKKHPALAGHEHRGMARIAIRAIGDSPYSATHFRPRDVFRRSFVTAATGTLAGGGNQNWSPRIPNSSAKATICAKPKLIG